MYTSPRHMNAQSGWAASCLMLSLCTSLSCPAVLQCNLLGLRGGARMGRSCRARIRSMNTWCSEVRAQPWHRVLVLMRGQLRMQTAAAQPAGMAGEFWPLLLQCCTHAAAMLHPCCSCCQSDRVCASQAGHRPKQHFVKSSSQSTGSSLAGVLCDSMTRAGSSQLSAQTPAAQAPGRDITSAGLTPVTIRMITCCCLLPAGSDISELTVLTNGPGAPEQPQQPPALQAQQAQVQPPAVSSAPPAPQVSAWGCTQMHLRGPEGIGRLSLLSSTHASAAFWPGLC